MAYIAVPDECGSVFGEGVCFFSPDIFDISIEFIPRYKIQRDRTVMRLGPISFGGADIDRACLINVNEIGSQLEKEFIAYIFCERYSPRVVVTIIIA